MRAAAGPTEFLLGSHVKGAKLGPRSDWWAAAQEAGDPQVTALQLAITADEGSAILFDLRVRHRGGANRSPEPRSILYIGYTMRWFRDAVNFKDPHTPQWDALGSDTRRALLARIDSRAYVRRLELHPLLAPLTTPLTLPLTTPLTLLHPLGASP